MDGALALVFSLLAVILVGSTSRLLFSSRRHLQEQAVNHAATPIHPKFRSFKYKTECGIPADLSFIGCEVCKLAVDGLQDLVKKQSSQEDIVEFMTFICQKFKIEDDRVCDAIIQEYKVFKIFFYLKVQISSGITILFF
jgi:hypothetical protein